MAILPPKFVSYTAPVHNNINSNLATDVLGKLATVILSALNHLLLVHEMGMPWVTGINGPGYAVM